MNIKQVLLKSSLGGLLLDTRDKIELVKTALFNPESSGTVSNDILSTKLISRLCSANSLFIDIGSHIGSVIYEAHRHNPHVNLIGIEAIPEKVNSLRKNFPYAKFYECALGDKNSTCTFYINKSNSGYSSLLKPQDNSNDIISSIEVQIKTLDSLDDFKNVDAIKIDVEGAELRVIKGAQNTISKNQPAIMFESGPKDTGTIEQLWELFNSLDYGLHLPNRVAHDDTPLSKDSFLDSHLYPRHTTNYFSIPFERRIEFRDRARNVLNI